MNANDPIQFLQKGFHITLGAAASVVESLQDAQKRQDNLNQLRANPNQFAEGLASKGQSTEQDARTMVDQLWRPGQQVTNPVNAATVTEDSTANRFQQELAELTQQIADIRAQLEQARESKG
jgi:polyhydroxyalkanoate synthesis regulator phasin